MMKRYNYLFLLLVTLCSMTFVACDDDDDWYYDEGYYGHNWRDGDHRGDQPQDQIDFVKMAQTLAGDWHGTTQATFKDNTGKWVTVKYYTENGDRCGARCGSETCGTETDFRSGRHHH